MAMGMGIGYWVLCIGYRVLGTGMGTVSLGMGMAVAWQDMYGTVRYA